LEHVGNEYPGCGLVRLVAGMAHWHDNHSWAAPRLNLDIKIIDLAPVQVKSVRNAVSSFLTVSTQ
jgi:hypothetical protein